MGTLLIIVHANERFLFIMNRSNLFVVSTKTHKICGSAFITLLSFKRCSIGEGGVLNKTVMLVGVLLDIGLLVVSNEDNPNSIGPTCIWNKSLMKFGHVIQVKQK